MTFGSPSDTSHAHGVIALLLGLPLSMAALRLALAQGLVIGTEVNVWLIGFAIAMILLRVALRRHG